MVSLNISFVLMEELNIIYQYLLIDQTYKHYIANWHVKKEKY